MNSKTLLEKYTENVDSKHNVVRSEGVFAGEQVFLRFPDGTVNMRYDEDTEVSVVKLIIELFTDDSYEHKFPAQRKIKFTPK